MKMNIFYLLILFNGCIFAKYDLMDLHKITKGAPHEIINAMKYLDQLERDFDADWQIYHDILPRMINEHKFKTGVEIGVSFGTHCKKILERTQVEKLYGIDPYLNYGDPTNTAMPDLWFDVFYHKVADKLSQFGSRFELLRDFSTQAALKFDDASLDFIFLDVNHTFKAVMEDLRAWYPKVKSGGIMAGDDYATCHPGVPLAVDAFFKEKGLEVHLDSNQKRFWWVVKR